VYNVPIMSTKDSYSLLIESQYAFDKKTSTYTLHGLILLTVFPALKETFQMRRRCLEI